MLQEQFRVFISISKEWFYKVPESVETAGGRLFEGIGFSDIDYDDNPALTWVHYDKMIDASDIPTIMSNYANFPLYGLAYLASIKLSIEHKRLSENPTEISSTDWRPSQADADIASVFRVNKTVKKGL